MKYKVEQIDKIAELYSGPLVEGNNESIVLLSKTVKPVFDNKNKLYYKPNQHIIELNQGIKDSEGSTIKYSLKGESATQQGKILSICECSDRKLVLLEITEAILEESFICKIIDSAGVKDVNYQCPHYLMYSPGDDDPPVPRQPLNCDREKPCNKPAGKYDEQYLPDVYKYLEINLPNDKSGFPVVAIMDTGLDLFYWRNYNCPLYKFENKCNGDKIYGKNFVSGSSGYAENIPFDDDECNKHGTRIAKLIANHSRNKVHLMILKTFNHEGFANFFDIFCAFEFLLKNKVDIINASWGYYSRPIQLFRNYIKRLTEEGIWFVNAAGNESDFGSSIDIGNVRFSYDGSTEIVKRYPACYSSEFNKVITVTTLKTEPKNTIFSIFGGETENSYSMVENFSETYVNIGVDSGKDGGFRDPFNTNCKIKGSSYATAIFVGEMVNKLNQMDETESLTRSQIINTTSRIQNNMEEGVRSNRVLETNVSL